MLTEDFKEFLQLLNAHQVKYIVVGGHAVIYHGYVRYTGDLDVWISNSEENASKMVKVMNEFGFSSLGLTQKDFMDQDVIFQLGHPPDRIDIITSVAGLEFDDSFARAIKSFYDGIETYLFSLDDLRKNKLAAGRPQDLADIDRLKKKK